MAELASEKEAIEAQLAEDAPQSEVIALHPAAVARYLAQIERLNNAVNKELMAGESQSEVRDFRALVESVIVYEVPPGATLDVEIRGRLAELTGNRTFPPQIRMSGGMLVAAEGFEPPTKGL